MQVASKAALFAAAASVYEQSDSRLMLAQLLISQMTAASNGYLISPVVDCYTAAASLGLPVDSLLHEVHGDAVFRVFRAADPAAGVSVALDQSALLSAANRHNVVPAMGYVQGVYPLRPGAPNCPFYMKHGWCDFRQNCVYNHPGYDAYGAMPTAAIVPVNTAVYQQMQPGPPSHLHPQYTAAQHQPPVPAHVAPPPPPPRAQSQSGYEQHASAAPGGTVSSDQQGPSTLQAGGQMGLTPASYPTASSMREAPQQAGGQMGLSPASYPTASSMKQAPQQPGAQQADTQVSTQHSQEEQEQGKMMPGGGVQPASSGQDGSVPAVLPHASAAARDALVPSPPEGSTSTEMSSRGTALLAALQRSAVGRSAGDSSGSSSSAVAPPNASWGALGQNGNGSSTAASVPASNSSSVQEHNTSVSAAAGADGGLARAQPLAQSNSSRSSGGPASVPSAGRVQANGIYLEGVPADITREELYALFTPYGRILKVDILALKFHTTKCAFVDFAQEDSARQVLALKTLRMGGVVARIRPKVVKGSQAAAGQLKATSAGASSSSAPAAAAAMPSAARRHLPKLMGQNELGLPQLRGAPCCPYFMGTGSCRYVNACKFHHPSYALHPECVLAGKMPKRYDTNQLAPYARLVNHTERLWDYESCVEAQLKIWLARHLLAKENSGCGMFDESAAVPAAPGQSDYYDEEQPTGPYSCTIEEAEQVLLLLWRAQPDGAAQEIMPYKGAVQKLLKDDPYYDFATDPFSTGGSSWVKLNMMKIVEQLNF